MEARVEAYCQLLPYEDAPGLSVTFRLAEVDTPTDLRTQAVAVRNETWEQQIAALRSRGEDAEIGRMTSLVRQGPDALTALGLVRGEYGLGEAIRASREDEATARDHIMQALQILNENKQLDFVDAQRLVDSLVDQITRPVGGPSAADRRITRGGQEVSALAARGPGRRTMRILPTRTTSSTDPGPGAADRRLRVLTGVDEELLARVRTERARYSALGAVMVCTAAIGGFSMFFALEEIIGGVRPWFVLAALGWAVFVLCLDRWLVSSSGGSRWRTRASVLAPRLVIACFFGFLIAEPIVLRIFEPSVLSVVAQDRQQHLDHLRQELLACNRPPGAADASQPAGADCADRDLGLSGELGAVSRKLDQLRSQAEQLRTGIAEDQKTLAGLRQTVNEECNGTEGRGLTGRAGNGPACQYDQEAVRNFVAAHPVEDQQRQLAELDRAITEASKGRAGTESDFQNLLVRRIDERLKQEDQPGAPVGLGDRFDALFALA
ncbi:DUF4407 domain-containing protein [Kitasatospora arboriphila]